MKRFLITTLWTFAKALLFTAACLGLFMALLIHGSKSDPYTSAGPAPLRVPTMTQAAFQTMIADVYHVETSSFIQPDLIHFTLASGVDPQPTCQAVANLWAHHSGLPWVRVESWKGNQRLAQATVKDGIHEPNEYRAANSERLATH